MKKLHSGVKWSFRITGYFVMLFLSFILGWLIGPASIFLTQIFLGISLKTIIVQVVIAVVAYIIFSIIVIEIYARMAYNRWFYEFTDSQLRLERGIIWKRYSNIPYERVQNVDITRGIIARLCGFSTVNIQTAGFSYNSKGGGIGSEGYIPAVSVAEAEHIREFLMKKISKRGRKQGL
jgi:putative membrane protein